MLDEINVAGLEPREFQRLQHPPTMRQPADERKISALEQIAAALCRIDHRLEALAKSKK